MLKKKVIVARKDATLKTLLKQNGISPLEYFIIVKKTIVHSLDKKIKTGTRIEAYPKIAGG